MYDTGTEDVYVFRVSVLARARKGIDRSEGMVHGHTSLVWTGTHDGI